MPRTMYQWAQRGARLVMGLVSYHKWSLEGTSNFSTAELSTRWSHPSLAEFQGSVGATNSLHTSTHSSFT